MPQRFLSPVDASARLHRLVEIDADGGERLPAAALEPAPADGGHLVVDLRLQGGPVDVRVVLGEPGRAPGRAGAEDKQFRQ